MMIDYPKMSSLGIEETDKKWYYENKVDINKKVSAIRTKARRLSKLDYCYYCKKSASSFCNSHSVPRFCLDRIAVEGKVYFSNTLIDLPLLKSEQGINEAGTFQLICRDCDSKIFQEYENPLSYDTIPTGKMLAQIAMKNFLLMIGNRLLDKATYNLMYTDLGSSQDQVNYRQKIISLDLVEYDAGYNRAKQGALGNHDNWYYLCYYQRLDYTVPIAFQSGITMICDFNDQIINNIYDMSIDNHTKDIHIAVFPLEKSSVIIIFIDSRDKCYKNFYKQLRELPLQDQLAVINYIIFSYSENVYFSKQINNTLLGNKALISTCQRNSDVIMNNPFDNPLNTAILEYSLSKRNEIPNLLSKEFCIE